MKTELDRGELTSILERFWGTSDVQRLTAGPNEVPTATVICKDLWDVNSAVSELIGENQCERVEIDRAGATVYLWDRDPEHIPFADAE